MSDQFYSQHDKQEVEFPRRIIVKFKSGVLPYEDGAEQQLPEEFQSEWKYLGKEYP